jgi:hypothetical protein
MTREQKCELAIEKGFSYNQETGKIYGVRGNKIISKNDAGYIMINLAIGNNKKVQLRGHQFAWYFINKECVECLDHINGVRDDNRIINLRSVTYQQNNENKVKAKGYSFHKKSNKWKSEITINGRRIHLGLFNNKKDAHFAYLKAKYYDSKT